MLLNFFIWLLPAILSSVYFIYHYLVGNECPNWFGIDFTDWDEIPSFIAFLCVLSYIMISIFILVDSLSRISDWFRNIRTNNIEKKECKNTTKLW